MDLKTKVKRNKLVRSVREYFDPLLKERRQHYDSWVRRYIYEKHKPDFDPNIDIWTCPKDGVYSFVMTVSGGNKERITMKLPKGYTVKL